MFDISKPSYFVSSEKMAKRQTVCIIYYAFMAAVAEISEGWKLDFEYM